MNMHVGTKNIVIDSKVKTIQPYKITELAIAKIQAVLAISGNQ